MPFIEERLDTTIQLRSNFGLSTATDVIETFKDRYTRLKHPYVQRRFSCIFNNQTIAQQLTKTIDLYHRAGGMYSGFRIKHYADFSTNGYTGTPTAYDQPCVAIEGSPTTYQIVNWYGDYTDTDCLRMRVRKPVSGTVLVGFVDYTASPVTYRLATLYSVDSTTGVISLTSDLPTGSEIVTAGCYFDIPVAFASNIEAIEWTTPALLSDQIELIELLNPA